VLSHLTESHLTRSDVLLVTELFPPAVGGSAELLRNVYSRLDRLSVTVLTDEVAAPAGEAEPRDSMHIVRRRLRYPQWGLLHPAGLSQHLQVASAIGRLSQPSDVVHCARALPEGLGAFLASRAMRRPYVCWAHGEELSYVKSSRELTWLMRRVIHGAAALVANSRNTAAMLADFGAPADRLHVIHPGVDSARFRRDAERARAMRSTLAGADDLLLLTVGRLQRRKGHDHVIEALSGLVASHPHLRYVIVGDGEERARLERIAAERGVADRVVFAGVVAPETLPAYYAAADLFVHPNRVEAGDFEGFGIVFLEAAAASLPVIGGNTGGVPEAVSDGRNGVLVSGTDVEELRAAIVRFADDPALRASMGRAGREMAASAFDWSSAAGKLAAIHEQVARTSRARG
jgi:phosphatidylinositol alpha-1,6-mannosyltransferase